MILSFHEAKLLVVGEKEQAYVCVRALINARVCVSAHALLCVSVCGGVCACSCSFYTCMRFCLSLCLSACECVCIVTVLPRVFAYPLAPNSRGTQLRIVENFTTHFHLLNTPQTRQF